MYIVLISIFLLNLIHVSLSKNITSNHLSQVNESEPVTASKRMLFDNEGIIKKMYVNVFPEKNSSDGRFTWNTFNDLIKSSATGSVLGMISSTDAFKGSNVTDACKYGLDRYSNSLSNLETWAVKMSDANGKIAGGVLEGRLMIMGSFEECLKIRVNSALDHETEEFRGQYCTVSYSSPVLRSISFKNDSLNQHYREMYGEPPGWIQDLIARSGPYLTDMALHFGACVPSNCPNEDLQRIITQFTAPLGIEVEISGCQVEEPLTWTKSFIAATSVLSAIAILCILGTSLDIAYRFTPNQVQEVKTAASSECFTKRLLKMFSVLSNVEILLNKNNRNSFGCFDGIRFLSITWIILHHNYAYQLEFREYGNSIDLAGDFNGFLTSVVIGNANLAVGTFFFISGFLMSYSLLKKLERKEKVDFLKYFLHKYWRFTPSIALILAVVIVVANTVSGPLWKSTVDTNINICYTHWWKTLLYINNWWNLDEMCLVHTWFVSCLLQFHVMGFILVHLTFRWPLLGVLVGLILLLGCIAVVVLVVIWAKFPLPWTILRIFSPFPEDMIQFLRCRPTYYMQSYIIGMTTGYLVLKYKGKKIKPGFQALGWMLSLIGSQCVVYGIYGLGSSPENVMFYHVFHFTLWCACLSWLTYACISGYGGFINGFLSWNAFHFLSNIGYLVYLLHVIIIDFNYGYLRELNNYGKYEAMLSFSSVLMITHFTAFIGHVAVEMPFIHMEKVLF